MDTVSFLSHVLPTSGFICLAEFTSGGWVKQHFYTTVEEAAQAIRKIDETTTVYHATATYKTTENRKQDNVKLVKSFFLDLDVGKGKDYESRSTAKEAIVALCTTLGIHIPTLISSGRGVHAYFVFDEAVAGDVWKPAVMLFRQVLDSVGFKHDPSRTTDQASILRPVGSTWRKDGERSVTAVYESKPKPFAWYMEKINAYIKAHGLAPAVMMQVPGASLFKVERLGVKSEYPPSSAVIIANLCMQVANVRNCRGAVPEPEWRNVIGVVKHTTEGDELAHEWSQGDPRYDRDETQIKIDRWETGPTTCEQFTRTAAHLCNGCKFKDKIKSPIQLGYIEIKEAPKELEQSTNVETDKKLSDYWPSGYRWDEGSSKFLRLIKSEDGIPEWVPFCNSFFYPTTRTQLEDGTWAQRIRMQVTKGKYREFDLPTKHLASQDALCTALAAHEVVIMPKKGFYAMTYLSDFRDNLQKAEVEMQRFKHFGWTDEEKYDSFIIGDSMIHRNGQENRVLLSEKLKLNDFAGRTAAGSAEEWARILNQAYNRPGAEVYQFTIMALLASPLVGVIGIDSWRGIPVGLTGMSGQGKTTVGRAACSAYGPNSAFVFEANNATDNSPDPFAGMMRNLPFVLDELTGKDPVAVSNRLYGLSNGQGRLRMDKEGNASPSNHSWRATSLITGNSNINEAMAQLARHQAEASQVRVFEYQFEGHESQHIFKGENIQELIETDMGNNHYGVAGRNAIRVMMNSVKPIRDDFTALRKKLGFESKGYDSKERYFVDLIATAYIGGKIFADLGYIGWNINNVRDWAVAHMENMRTLRSRTYYPAEERAAQFIGTLVGHILVTKHFDSATTENSVDSYPIRGEVKARMALTAKKFFVSSRVFDEWCKTIQVQPSVMRTELLEAGVLISSSEKAFLTKGTTIPSARQRVLEFNFDRVSGIAKPAEEAKVIPIHG